MNCGEDSGKDSAFATDADGLWLTFPDHLTCKDRSILVDIVDIVQIRRTRRIGRMHQDSCCCEMRS